MRKHIFIFYIFTFLFLISATNLGATPFGWEDSTTQGWLGDVNNSTSYYYSGGHSLSLSLNLSGKGFKSNKAVLPIYSGQGGEVLDFKIYIPSVPKAPFDLQAHIYAEDAQGRRANSYSFVLFANRWNDISFVIPPDFKGPLSLSIAIGTELEYVGTVYIDQPEGMFSKLGSKEEESNNTNPAYYRTYVPYPSETQAAYTTEPSLAAAGAAPRTGGLGIPTSSGLEAEEVIGSITEDSGIQMSEQTVIPEPATILLVSGGLLSWFFRPRKLDP